MPPPLPPFKKKSTAGQIHKPTLHPDDPTKAVSYINLTILDASTAVKNMVRMKMNGGKFPAPSKLKERVAERVATAAANKVPPSAVAKGMSTKLPKILMYKLNEKLGLQLAAQTVFVEDVYVVMQFQVQYVDSSKLLAKLKETPPENDDDESVASAVVDAWIEEQKETLSNLDEIPDQLPLAEIVTAGEEGTGEGWKTTLVNFLEMIITKIIPDRAKQNLEEERLPAIVQQKITEEMQNMMEQKLAKKSLVADIAVLPETQQARYFFSNLNEVRERQMLKKK